MSLLLGGADAHNLQVFSLRVAAGAAETPAAVPMARAKAAAVKAVAGGAASAVARAERRGEVMIVDSAIRTIWISIGRCISIR